MQAHTHTRTHTHRFTPALVPEGADSVINVFRALCILGGDAEEASAAEAAVVAWKQHQVCVCFNASFLRDLILTETPMMRYRM